MRVHLSALLVITQFATPFFIPMAHAADIKYEPKICSDVVSSFLQKEYGIKNEDATLPKNVEKAKYNAMGLEQSFEKAQAKVTGFKAEEKIRIAKDVAKSTVKYAEELKKLGTLEAAADDAETEQRKLKYRLLEIRDVEAGTGLSELKEFLNQSFEKAKLETKTATEKLAAGREAVDKIVAKDGLRVYESAGRFILVPVDNAKSLEAALQRNDLNPAMAAREEIEKIMSYAGQKEISNSTELIVLKQTLDPSLAHKLKAEEGKYQANMKLVMDLKTLEAEALKNPQLKSLQADYKAKKSAVEKMDPDQYQQALNEYTKIKPLPEVKILREKGIIKGARLGGFMISCDEVGRLKAFRPYYGAYHTTSVDCEKGDDTEKQVCDFFFSRNQPKGSGETKRITQPGKALE
jgi:hypothetical protein